MNEDVFNMSLRKFLKQVGVTSQREIEKAVRDAVDSGALPGGQAIKARVTVSVDEIGLQHRIEGEIDLG